MGGHRWPQRWLGGIRTDALALFALSVLGGAFLFELATLRGVPFVRDIQFFFLPHKRILWNSLQAGEIPLWSSLVNSGYPVLANFQSGVFYPPHWLYAAAPFLVAFNWLIVFHLLLAGVGAYLLCRHLDFSPAGSWIAALAFMLGGYLVSLTNLINALQTAAWTPLLFLTLSRQIRRPGPGRFASLVGTYLLAFLAGAPYTFALGAFLAAGFVIVRLRSESDSGVTLRSAFLSLGVGAVVVGGIAAVQILPTMEMVSQSTRATGLSLGESGRYALDPAQLLNLVFPNDFSDPVYRYGHKPQLTDSPPWLYSIYLGTVPLILALFSLGPRERRAPTVFLAAAAVAGIVLGLGPHTSVFAVLHEHVPGVDSFRFPEKFFFLTGFSVPILAASGYDSLRRRLSGGTIALGVASVATVSAVGLDLYWRFSRGDAESFITSTFAGSPASEHPGFAYEAWTAGLDQVAFLFLASLVVITLYRWRRIGRWLFTGLMLLLVVADLWLAHRHLVPLVDPSFYRQPPRVASQLPMEDIRTRHRYWASPFDENAGMYYSMGDLAVSTQKWIWQQTVQPSSGPMHDMLTLDSGDAIHLDRVAARTQLLKKLSEAWRWRLLEVSGVSHLYSPLDFEAEHYAGRTNLDSIPGYIYELKAPVPRVYLAKGSLHSDEQSVLRYTIAPGRRGDRPVAMVRDSAGLAPSPLRNWASSQADFLLAPVSEAGPEGALRMPSRPDPADSVMLPPDRVVEDGHELDLTRASPGRAGTAEIVSDSGEKLVVRVEPREAGFLMLADTYYPGWEANVDGERRPLLAGNYFFRSVPVLPGDRRVVFRYVSEPLRVGAWLSGASIVLLVAGLVVWHMRRRRS